MIPKNLNQALFAAMFGEETEVIVENVGENLETLTELNDKGECGPIKSLLKFLSWLFKNVNKKTALGNVTSAPSYNSVKASASLLMVDTRIPV